MKETRILLEYENKASEIVLKYDNPFDLKSVEYQGDGLPFVLYDKHMDDEIGYFIRPITYSNIEKYLNVAYYLNVLYSKAGYKVSIKNPPNLSDYLDDEDKKEGRVY